MNGISRDMNWPTLKQFYQWVAKITPNLDGEEEEDVEPWDVNAPEYQHHMKELLQNL